MRGNDYEVNSEMISESTKLREIQLESENAKMKEDLEKMHQKMKEL